MLDQTPYPPDPHGPPRSVPQVRDNDNELILVKDDHRYVFRCALGEEKKLIDQLAQMVRDPDIDVDWFDAAVLSHQLGARMSRRLQTIQRT